MEMLQGMPCAAARLVAGLLPAEARQALGRVCGRNIMLFAVYGYGRHLQASKRRRHSAGRVMDVSSGTTGLLGLRLPPLAWQVVSHSSAPGRQRAPRPFNNSLNVQEPRVLVPAPEGPKKGDARKSASRDR